MSRQKLLSSLGKDEVLRAVREIECNTSAEVVVVIRAASGNYLPMDMLVGCMLAFLWLCVFLFHPEPFDDDLLPFEVLGLFVLGTVVTSKVAPLRRLLLRKSWREDAVVRAAQAAFVENGVFRTKGRTGLLVYVSLLERRVVFLGDVGIESANVGEALKTAQTNVEMALVAPNVTKALTEALGELGEALARALPCSREDVNELPDEVAA